MDIPRSRLKDLPRHRLHAGRNATKAIVDLIEIDGRSLVLKDLSERPWPVRTLLGPWQLDREARAYRRLKGTPGVPRFVGRVDRQALLMEYIAGRDLSRLRPGDLDEGFFDRLEKLLELIHAKGVAHGDLNRSDVVAGEDGRPYVLDFSTAVLSARPDRFPRSLIFAQACRIDRRSLAKLRLRFLPTSSGPVPHRGSLHRFGRMLKSLFDRTRRRPPR